MMDGTGGLKRAGRMAGALLGMAWLAACASNERVAAPPPPVQAPPPPVVAAPPPPPARTVVDDGKTRVALLVPLTGRAAQVGQAMLDAAQMAVFDVADGKFELMPRDTGGTPEGAARAAQDALDGGAKLVLGPLLSAEAQAVKPVAAAAGVPVLTFSNDWNLAGGNLWVMGFVPQEQVTRVVRYAQAQGIATFGLMAPANAYGEAARQAMAAAIRPGTGQLTRVERYGPGQDLGDVVKRLSDFEARRQALERERALLSQRDDEASRQALRRLSNLETFGDLPFQALMIAEGGAQLRAIAPLMPFFDVDPGPVRFLGTGLWDEPGIGREPALVGGWFAAPAPEARQDFERRYQELYGSRPPRLATLAYDAAAMAGALAKGRDARPFEVRDLTNPNGFAGADGIFRLLPNGLVERGLAVIEVTRDGFTVIDPAPSSFEAAGS